MKNFYKVAKIIVSEEKIPCPKGYKKTSLEYEGIRYAVCYSVMKKDVPSKIAKLASSEIGKWIITAMYGYYTQRSPSFYYLHPKRKDLVSFSVTENSEDEIEVTVYYAEGPLEDDEIYDINEEIHQGLGAIEISKSPEEIKKEYVKDDTLKILLVVLLLAGVIGYASYALLFEEEEKPVVHKKPVVRPLTEYERNELRREISKSIMADLAKDILKIKSEPLIENRRIEKVVVRLSNLKPQRPYKTKSGEWKFKTKWKRGGYYVSVMKTYAQDFPGVGFKKKGEGVFQKKVSKKRKWTELDMNASKLLHPSYLTKECLIAPLYYQDASPDIISRSASTIKIALRNTYPSGFLKDFYEYFEKCPAYLEKIGLNSGKGKINMTITLYVPEKTPGFGDYVRKIPKGKGSVKLGRKHTKEKK